MVCFMLGRALKYYCLAIWGLGYKPVDGGWAEQGFQFVPFHPCVSGLGGGGVNLLFQETHPHFTSTVQPQVGKNTGHKTPDFFK